MSKEQLAKDLAAEIFDMIDRNYPRGLIKSELEGLIGQHMAAWQTKHDLINPDVFPPKPEVDIYERTWTSNKPEVEALMRKAYWRCGND